MYCYRCFVLFDYLCYGSTHIVNIVFLSVRVSTLDVRSESNVYRCQILISNDGPCAEKVKRVIAIFHHCNNVLPFHYETYIDISLYLNGCNVLVSLMTNYMLLLQLKLLILAAIHSLKLVKMRINTLFLRGIVTICVLASLKIIGNIYWKYFSRPKPLNFV